MVHKPITFDNIVWKSKKIFIEYVQKWPFLSEHRSRQANLKITCMVDL